MAIEVSPSSNYRMPLWASIVIIVDIILIIVFLSTFFYLSWSQKQTEQALIKTPQEEALEREVIKKQDELVLYTNKIEAFGKILQAHKKVGNVFGVLEKICLPNVWFNSFSFVLGRDEVSVSGIAKSFIALGNQVSVLKADSSFAAMDLSNIVLTKDGVAFVLQTILDSKILSSSEPSSPQ